MWYAQFGEDRKLAELLGDRPSGFYIDVGAWDPVHDSVTKHFYDRGWRGINVEPVPFYFGRLAELRPRDINLQIALSNQSGFAMMAIKPDTGLSTLRAEYSPAGSERSGVNTETLAAVCEEFIADGVAIDFLKIDVEGHEREVIAGGDWTRYRPEIVIVEATVPGTCGANAIETAHEFQDLLFAARYEDIGFDGLNRWYRRRDVGIG
jgi:FkbM family methyltransferase